MGKSNQNQTVVMGVRVEGGDDALAFVKNLRSAIGGLNGGPTGSVSASSPTAPYAPQAPSPPSVASAFTGRTFDPYQSNVIPNTTQQIGSFGMATAMGYRGSASMVPPAPLPPTGAGGSFGASGGVVGMGQNVVIHAANVSVGSGGVSIGSGSGTTLASSGGGNSSSLIPSAPLPGGGVGSGGGGGGQIPTGGGGASWGSFARSVMQSPTPGGIVNAGMNELPAGPAAVIAAAGYAASIGMNYAMESQRPGYDLQTQLLSNRARGQWIDPAQEAAMSKAAEMRGNLAGERALFSPIASIPIVGGAFENAMRLSRWQDMEREATVTEASGTADVARNRMNAMMGGGVRRGEDLFLLSRERLGGLSSRFGRRGVRGLNYANVDHYAVGFGEESAIGALQSIYGQGLRPEHQGMYDALASGTDPYGLAGTAGNLFAAEGDLAGVSALQSPLTRNSGKGAYDALMKLARQVQQLQLGIGQSGTRLSLGRATGMGYKELGKEYNAQFEQLGQWTAQIISMRNSAPADQKGDYDQLLLQVRAQQGVLPRQNADNEFGQRSVLISAASSEARTGFQKALYSGADMDVLGRGFDKQGAQLKREAALLRERSKRSDIYNESERAQYAAQADQAQQEADVMIPRQMSQNRYGLDMASLGVKQARTAQIGSNVNLFGAAGDMSGVNAQASDVAANIAAVKALLERGNLSATEQLDKTAELVRLGTQQRQLSEEQVRGKARGEYQSAQGGFGIASTERSTAFMTGVGGLEGEQLGFGVLNKSRDATNKASAYVDLLRQRGVAETNPEMIQARQQLASSQQQTVGAEIGVANTPMPLALTRGLDHERYVTDILQSMPGSYGNIRGSLRKQMQNLEEQGSTIERMREEAKKQYGGQVPSYVSAALDERAEATGRQMASVAQTLSHGWESRLVSQTLGTSGNFAFTARNFSLRDAIGAGIRNPHFGSSAIDRPFYVREMGEFGGGASIAGATGTPEGFGRTALSGTMPDGNFGTIAGLPGFVGGAGGTNYTGPQYSPVSAGGRSQGAGSGMGGASGRGSEPQRLVIELQWPDKSPAGKATVTLGAERISLGSNEDNANMFSQMLRGQ